MKQTNKTHKEVKLLQKYLSLPEVAREYIRLCHSTLDARTKMTEELFDAFRPKD